MLFALWTFPRVGGLGGRNSPPAYFAEHAELAFLLRISPGGNYSEVILMERRDVSETAKVYHVVEMCINFLEYLAFLRKLNT